MKKVQEITEDVVSLYKQKISIKKISKIVGASEPTVSKALKNSGIEITKKGYIGSGKYSEEKEREIIALYKGGKTQKEIGKLYNTSNTAIRRVLLRNKIQPRGVAKALRLCKNNPFRNKDEFSDYFLGLLITDGCISKKSGKYPSYETCLSLSEVDGYIVEKFRDWASPKTKVSKVYQKINGSYMYSLTLINEEMVEWLRRKGNFYRKSYFAKLYCPINWQILRGIFDGDGGFHVVNKNGLHVFICGLSEELMLQVKRFLDKEGLRASIRFSEPNKWHKKGLYYVELRYYEDVLKFGLQIYSNAHIFIKRKYEKWLTFYESRKDKYALNSGKETAIQP